MVKLYWAVLLVTLAVATNGFLFGGPAYNDLKVTFSLNPLNWWRFNSMPRTEDQAKSEGWTLNADGCKSNANSLPGRRYILKGDVSVILVFDMNGYIAGIQMGVPKDAVVPGKLGLKGAFIVDATGDYVLSVYFIESHRICDASKSRTADEFKQEGTANKVFLQIGQPADQVVEVPLTQDEVALGKLQFTRGKCFPSMGVHYWHDFHADSDCANIIPYCLLYNSGKFNGFCFAVSSVEFNNANPHRFEHPGATEAQLCCTSDWPKCLPTDTKSTTMHVYLDSTPYLNFC